MGVEARGWHSFRAVAGADSLGATDLSPSSRQRRPEFLGPSCALPARRPSDGELTPWGTWALRSSGPVPPPPAADCEEAFPPSG